LPVDVEFRSERSLRSSSGLEIAGRDHHRRGAFEDGASHEGATCCLRSMPARSTPDRHPRALSPRQAQLEAPTRYPPLYDQWSARAHHPGQPDNARPRPSVPKLARSRPISPRWTSSRFKKLHADPRAIFMTHQRRQFEVGNSCVGELARSPSSPRWRRSFDPSPSPAARGHLRDAMATWGIQ